MYIAECVASEWSKFLYARGTDWQIGKAREWPKDEQEAKITWCEQTIWLSFIGTHVDNHIMCQESPEISYYSPLELYHQYFQNDNKSRLSHHTRPFPVEIAVVLLCYYVD